GQTEASGRIGSPNQDVPERVTIEREARFQVGYRHLHAVDIPEQWSQPVLSGTSWIELIQAGPDAGGHLRDGQVCRVYDDVPSNSAGRGELGMASTQELRNPRRTATRILLHTPLRLIDRNAQRDEHRLEGSCQAVGVVGT